MYNAIYSLPTKVSVNGVLYDIRSDFRAILDICIALNDPDLSPEERATVALIIFYLEYEKITDGDSAFGEVLKFINHGEPDDTQRKTPKLMDWEQDFKVISPGIDKVLGYSSRQCEYLHWWEFLGAYYEIGEGLFSTVVAIRNKLSKGKKLEPYERELLASSPSIVKLRVKLTNEENEFLKRLELM